jgi:hypothetical protein
MKTKLPTKHGGKRTNAGRKKSTKPKADDVLFVRVTREELRLITESAKKSLMRTRSAWVRAKLLNDLKNLAS